MKKLGEIKLFFKDFWKKCKSYYAIYSIFSSTVFFYSFLFLFSNFLYYLILIEVVILIIPLGYFYCNIYEKRVSLEIFYYFEKIGKYKQKAQLIRNLEQELIIKSDKTYIFFFQFKIGKKIKKYELSWNKNEMIQISLGDNLSFLELNENILICNKNENYSFILAIEYFYLDKIPLDTEFILSCKIKNKIKELVSLNIRIR